MSSPTGCWVWTGSRDEAGYGKFTIFTDGKWKDIRAHKYAAELVVGKLPSGTQALHACDNPSCVRFHPQHIFTGTHRDNMADKVRKSRQAKGEAAGNAKLAKWQVVDIRKRRLVREGVVKIAAHHGISPATVSAISLRQTWKHVE